MHCTICNAPAVKPGRRCTTHRFKRTCQACGTQYFGKGHTCQLRTCSHCGTQWIGRKRKYCTRECRAEHDRLALLKPKVRWHCDVCDELVTRDSGPVGMYCKKHKHWNDSRRANAQRRRALISDPTAEVIKPTSIYQRDRWKCGLCGLPVDKRLTHPHPRSASLDHITPLARGGTHTKANVQCAHLDCNLRKGSRESEQQLLLIG